MTGPRAHRGSNSEISHDLLTFVSVTRTVAGVPVDSAQFLINYLSTQGLPGTLAQQTAQALGRQSATQAPRQYYADMSATLVKMRRVELQVAQGIVARGQSLRQDARRSALLSAAVTVAIALAVLLATFLASRSRDGDDRARGRTARNAASGGV